MTREFKHVAVCVGATFLLSFILDDVAHAQSVFGKADSFLQKVVDGLTGTTGKLISMIAVVAVGLAAVFGRIEWTKALIVLGGIAIIVGAPQIVNTLWG